MEFEVREVLGLGSASIVYRAFDHHALREVALKEYLPASLLQRGEAGQLVLRTPRDQGAFARGLRSFIQAARLLARCDHPALIQVHRFWEANGTAYLAMPVVRGSTLQALRSQVWQPPDEGPVRSLALDLLGALEVLHREGVIHRDVAPDNIIVRPDGRHLLLDFGAAGTMESGRIQALPTTLKPGYAAIEQYTDGVAIKQGPWTDLYGLGATLHFLLLRRPPAPATTRVLSDTAPLASTGLQGYSQPLLQAIDWMLALRPDDRPRSAAAVRALLDGGRHADEPPPKVEARVITAIPPPRWNGVERTQALPPVSAPAPATVDPMATPQAPARTDSRPIMRPAPAQAPDSATPPGSRSGIGLGSALSRIGQRIAAWLAPAPRESPPTPAPGGDSPLFFGLTAPRSAAVDAEFSVSFAAYVASARTEALRQSRALVGEHAAPLMDVEPSQGSTWKRGTPFVVRLSGRSFAFEPAEQAFEWNGTKNVLCFGARLLPTAHVSAVLTATVQVHGIVVASIPFQVQVEGPVAVAARSGELAQRIRPAPLSAFASYASKDIAEVAGRLSALTRHAPGLQIFQDCLDLRPGEPYKTQLQTEIAGRDVFWLFWSRQAAASPWVRWELDTAIARKPMETIIPMPLEDPSLAPPPPELEHEHFRDRFMIAGQALLRVQEQVRAHGAPGSAG